MYEHIILALIVSPIASLVWETPPDKGLLFHNHYMFNTSTVLVCNQLITSTYTISYGTYLQLLEKNTKTLSTQLQNWFSNITKNYNEDAKIFNQTQNYRVSGTSKKVNFLSAFNTCRRYNSRLLEFTDEHIIETMETFIEDNKKIGKVEESRYLWTPIISSYIPVFALSNKQIPAKYKNQTIQYQLTADTCHVFDIKSKSFLSRNCNTPLHALCLANIQPHNMFNYLVMFNKLKSVITAIQKTTKLVLTRLNNLDPYPGQPTAKEDTTLFNVYEQKIINNSINLDSSYLDKNINHIIIGMEMLNEKLQLLLTSLLTNKVNKSTFSSPCCEEKQQTESEEQIIHYTQGTNTNIIFHLKTLSGCVSYPSTKVLPLSTNNVYLNGEYLFLNNSCFKSPKPAQDDNQYHNDELQEDSCCHNLLRNSYANCSKQITYPSFFVKNDTMILISTPSTVHIESTCAEHSTNSSIALIKKNLTSTCTFFSKYPFFSPVTGTLYTHEKSSFKPSIPQKVTSSISILDQMIPYLAICSSIATVLTCLVSIFVIYYKTKWSNTNNTTNTLPSPVPLRPILKTRRTKRSLSSDSDDSSSS